MNFALRESVGSPLREIAAPFVLERARPDAFVGDDLLVDFDGGQRAGGLVATFPHCGFNTIPEAAIRASHRAGFRSFRRRHQRSPRCVFPQLNACESCTHREKRVRSQNCWMGSYELFPRVNSVEDLRQFLRIFPKIPLISKIQWVLMIDGVPGPAASSSVPTDTRRRNPWKPSRPA